MSEQETRPHYASWLGVLAGAAALGGAVATLSQAAEFVTGGNWIELAVGFLGVALLAVVAGLVVRRLRPDNGDFEWGASRRVALVVACTFAGLLLLGALAVTGAILLPQPKKDERDRADPPAGTTAAPIPPAVGAGSELWQDDFEVTGLDPDRWRRPDRSDVIGVQDGRLKFRVTPQVTPEDFLTVTVAPRGLPASIRSVALTATVEQVTSSQGGVDLIVRQASGRESRLRMGPSPAGPGVEPWVCPHLPCGATWSEFLHPTSSPFVDGEPSPVEVVHTGGRVELRAAGVTNAAPPDATPIADVGFLLEAGRGEAWTVTVDDLTIR